MDRKINPINIDTTNFVDCLVDTQYRSNKIVAKISVMDGERIQLLFKKETLIKVDTENVIYAIKLAYKDCQEQAVSHDQTFCVETKQKICYEIKNNFIKKVEKYNDLLTAYKTNFDYIQLKAHDMTGLEVLDVKDLIGKENLASIDCDLTITSERTIHQENTLLTQGTRTKEIIKIEEEGKTNQKQPQSKPNENENLETHKQDLYVAKTGEKNSIIITKISQIDKSTVVDTVLEQCENIIHNFNPLEGDTIDISQCGKYKVSQISFRTFTTDKTATGQIPISGVKIDGKEGYIACVYGFDADKFFDPYYVDPDTKVPHMLEIYDVITLTQPQGICNEL